MKKSSANDIYYFLGNITSHVIHALPLYKELGGTFIVLSEKAKIEVKKYDIPVINIDDKPYKLKRFGTRLKRVHEYLEVDKDLAKTMDFLNKNASAVIFYELFDFAPKVSLTRPKTIFLTHGFMLKNYLANNNRMEKINEYGYMAAVGPFLKKQFLADGISASKLVDLGIARTDLVVNTSGQVALPGQLAGELGIDSKKPVFAYLPTFWGASSIYDTGLEIVRRWPKKYTLIFRPHPQTPKRLLANYLEIINTRTNIIYAPEGMFKGFGLIELLAISSVIIGDVSSVMLEALLTEKPLVFAYDQHRAVEQTEAYELIKELVASSSQIRLDNIQEIPSVLSTALTSQPDLAIYKRAIKGVFYHADGTSVQAIADFVRSLIK